MKKQTFYKISAGAAAMAAFSFLGGYFSYRIIIVRRAEKDTEPKPGPSPTQARKRFCLDYEAQRKWLSDWGYKEVVIEGEDGHLLKGYFFKAKKPTKRTVLAVHGYRNNGLREYAYLAQMYLEDFGMNVLIVDDCAHGDSEGKRIGFSWRDRLDCIRWAKWLVEKMGPRCEILLQGISMGGATVLNAGGEKSLPRQVKWIVSDCAFDSMKNAILHVLRKTFHLPAFPFYYIASAFNRLFNGFWFEEADVYSQTAKIKVPVLFIHGEDDDFIPVEMGKRLYAACRSKKLLLLVPGAGHADSYLADKEGYKEAVAQLLKESPGRSQKRAGKV